MAVPRALPGVDADRLRSAVDGTWEVVAVLPTTGSTNDDASALPSPPGTAGSALGRVIVADHQSGGRGRLGRVWSAPPRGSVAVSVVLRPAVPVSAWGWLPLLAGQAAREAVAAAVVGAATVLLKWPNDVLIRGSDADGKICGLLAEVRGPDVVIGAGLNTNVDAAGLPVATATSLRLVTGGTVDPTGVVAGYLTRLASWWRTWHLAAGDAAACGLLAAHQRWSDTIGREVRVTVEGGAGVTGRALSVDEVGRLVVLQAEGTTIVMSAGDVIHVR